MSNKNNSNSDDTALAVDSDGFDVIREPLITQIINPENLQFYRCPIVLLMLAQKAQQRNAT